MLKEKSRIRMFLGVLPIALIIMALVAVKMIEDVHLSEEMIQSAADSALPLTTDGGITIESATVDIDEVLTVTVKASGDVAGQPFRAIVVCSGTISYEALKGEFYFLPEKIFIESFTVADASVAEHADDAIRIVRMTEVGSSLLSALSERGVDLSGAGERVEDQVEGLVSVAAERALRTFPVYTLPNDVKGGAVQLLLTSVEIEPGAVVAHLSLWKLTVRVITITMLLAVLLLLAIYAPWVLEIFVVIGDVLSIGN
jgi:hypothetical protein